MAKFISKIYKKILKRKWLLLVLILLVGGFLVYKTMFGKAPSDKQSAYVVKIQTLKDTLSLSGEIDAEEKAVLRFQTSGRLSWVGVKEGDFVKKYQSVASLDKRELQKKLDKYLIDYLTTRWDFEQTKDNYNQGQALTTSLQRILDKNQFGLNKSVIDVEIQNLSVEFANLWTPIEGIVTKVDSPYAGVNITPAQAEFEIVNPKTVYFSALADQTDVVKIQKITKTNIVFDSYPDDAISGKIGSIAFNPKADESGTVYEVKIILSQDNSDYHYRLGMTGDADFVLREKKGVLSIPLSYLKTEGAKKYVMKKDGDKLVKVFVTAGEEFDNDVEVKSGLVEGDTIFGP